MRTAHKSDIEKQEYFDKPQILKEKVKLLSDLIAKSNHLVIFTGAGISTSSGIKDFRSGKDTVVPTGPGAWQLQAQKISTKNDKKIVSVSTLRAVPSQTHMSLVALETYGILKYLVSQNVDGLHRRSGIPPEKLSELHGNTNLEICGKCGKQYMRDFRTRTALAVHDHKTGRFCDNDKCGGELSDTIINFQETLPIQELDRAFTHAQMADLMIVFGSSLRVNPAAQIPYITAQMGQNLVIVNLQSTPLDQYAAIRINGFCDQVMDMVMQNLEIPIPQFILERRVMVQQTKGSLHVNGIDSDGSPYTIFKQIVADYGKNLPFNIIQNGPYNIPISNSQLALKLGFYGHYGENPFRLDLDTNLLQENQQYTYIIRYSPLMQEWFDYQLINEQQ